MSREVLERLEAVAAADPKNTNVRRNIAVTHSMLGRNLLRLGDAAGAMVSHETSLRMIEELSSGKAGARENDKDVAVALWGLANAHSAAAQHEAALQHFRKALAIREPVIAADPTNAKARDDVASIYADMGVALTRAGRLGEAIEPFSKALPIAEKLSQSAPTNARLRARVASRYAEAAQPHLQRAHAADERLRACDYLRQSAGIWQELREANRLMPADAEKPEQVERELAQCADGR